MHSTILPVAGSRKVGSSQDRFSSNSSLLRVGKNSNASKSGVCCSTTRWMLMLPSWMADDIADHSLLECPGRLTRMPGTVYSNVPDGASQEAGHFARDGRPKRRQLQGSHQAPR